MNMGANVWNRVGQKNHTPDRPVGKYTLSSGGIIIDRFPTVRNKEEQCHGVEKMQYDPLTFDLIPKAGSLSVLFLCHDGIWPCHWEFCLLWTWRRRLSHCPTTGRCVSGLDAFHSWFDFGFLKAMQLCFVVFTCSCFKPGLCSTVGTVCKSLGGLVDRVQ